MHDFFHNHTNKELYGFYWDIRTFIAKQTFKDLFAHGVKRVKKYDDKSLDEAFICEIIHQSFDKVFNKKRYEIDKTFIVYMKGVISNGIVDYFRDKNRKSKKDNALSQTEETITKGSSPIESTDSAKYLKNIISECFKVLTKDERYVMTEKYYNNKSYKELALDLDKSEANIRMIHKKAKDKLYKTLIDKGFDKGMLGDFFE